MEEGAEMLGVFTNRKEWMKHAEHHLENAEKHIMSHVIPNAPTIKFEDATLSYQRAAEAYRITECWQEACDAYAKAADIQVRLGCPEEAASYSSEAAETMVKVRGGGGRGGEGREEQSDDRVLLQRNK